MCGIAGLWEPSRAGDQTLETDARSMAAALHHRGPDDAGSWTDPKAGIGLGHTRLAVVDLSPNGRQPMVSADGRYVIVYNGEIYNTEELRAALAGHPAWRGRSDTEVVLEACRAWGPERAVARFVGMFAFALWDRERRELTLVRDRLGIKPLYWWSEAGRAGFASELKAFAALRDWRPEIDPAAVSAYFRQSYIPAPLSIFKTVRKLRPGWMVTLGADGGVAERQYWELPAASETDSAGLPEAAVVDRFEALAQDAVSRRLVADVPVGVLLSGGIDSTAVALLAARAGTGRVQTFSVGFGERGFDESGFARGIADRLGTEHTELQVSPESALSVVDRLPEIYDEPFAASSQVPTYLISELARREITVALTGDGGDELLAGYNRHLWLGRLHRLEAWMPRGVRRAGASAARAFSPALMDRLSNALPRRYVPVMAGDKLAKLGRVLGQPSIDEGYGALTSCWADPREAACVAEAPPPPIWRDPRLRERYPGALERVLAYDTLTYLPDEVLTKVDRASMAVGLEARVPLLDHRLVEFAWRVAPRYKVRDGRGKWLLRALVERHLPRSLTRRPKMGFAVPVAAWLRGPLRGWAEGLLSEDRLAQSALLNRAGVRRRWLEHQSGARNWEHALWAVLMFQAWSARWESRGVESSRTRSITK